MKTTKENIKTNHTKSALHQKLDYDTILALKGLIKRNLAPYLKSVNCSNVKLSKANYNAKRQVQWFGFSARCPICHNANETGYCMVGIEAKEPNEISFRCRRLAKAQPYIQTDKNGKDYYSVVPMGKDKKGNDISDIYVMTYQSSNDSYWTRDSKKSQSKLVGLDGKSFHFQTVKVDEAKQEAPAAFQDIMNRFVLAKYKLSKEHLDNLKHRGFTDEDLKTFRKGTGFGSLTWRVRQYNDYLYQRQGDPHFSLWERALGRNEKVLAKMGLSKKRIANLWYGVPGFYLKQVEYNGKKVKVPYFNVTSTGMLVPYYNVFNQVIRFQVRLDEPKLKNTYVSKEDKKNFDFDRDGYDITTIFTKDKYNDWRNYRTYIYKLGGGEKTIVEGRLHKMDEWIDVTKQLHDAGYKDKSYRFKAHGKEDQKYFWISSSKKIDEESGGTYGVTPKYGTPVEVAYQPKIAVLSPNSKELAEYRKKPKNVWVTEGGLKALLAVRKLDKHFTDKELDLYGHDVLGVPGVESTAQLEQVLEELNVQNVTLAFDMDMFTRNNAVVAASLFKSAEALIKHGYGVRIAIWNGNVGKGLDDILVTNKCYMKFKNLKIKKG